MIVQVPVATPVTSPDELMVATAGLPELHIPPGVASLNVAVQPTQVVVLPTMGEMAKEAMLKNTHSKVSVVSFLIVFT